MVVLPGAVALAHGEHTQAGFLRMRTISFFDVAFARRAGGSEAEVPLKPGEDAVLKPGQDELVITGKFKVLEAWPENVAQPREAYLHAAAPGPRVLVKERWINGQFTPGAFFVEKGGTYEFRLVVAGRMEGRWHVHPAVYVKGAGPLVGPGQWVRVEPVGGAFTNPIKLLDGSVVDVERYGLGGVAVWHIITGLFAVIWLIWWLRRPVIARAHYLSTGATHLLEQPADHKFAYGMAAAVLVTIAAGYVVADRNYPVTIPVQVNRLRIPPLSLAGEKLSVKPLQAVYGPTTRTVQLDVEVRNNGSQPVELAEFSTAYLNFRNQRLAGEDAQHVMTVQPDGRIGPGEARKVSITLTDPAWETEKLMGLEEAQIAIAGVATFQTPDGQRQYVEISSPVRTDFQTMMQRLRRS